MVGLWEKRLEIYLARSWVEQKGTLRERKLGKWMVQLVDRLAILLDWWGKSMAQLWVFLKSDAVLVVLKE